MEIITKRCRVVPFTMEDLPHLHALLSNPLVMKYLEPPFTLPQTESFLKSAGLGESPLVHAVYSRGNEKFLGYLIFHPFDETGWELGWVLDPYYWGLGIARELTHGAINYAREHGIPRLVIECVPEQTTSAAIAELFGFTFQGIQEGCRVYTLDLET